MLKKRLDLGSAVTNKNTGLKPLQCFCLHEGLTFCSLRPCPPFNDRLVLRNEPKMSCDVQVVDSKSIPGKGGGDSQSTVEFEVNWFTIITSLDKIGPLTCAHQSGEGGVGGYYGDD